MNRNCTLLAKRSSSENQARKAHPADGGGGLLPSARAVLRCLDVALQGGRVSSASTGRGYRTAMGPPCFGLTRNLAPCRVSASSGTIAVRPSSSPAHSHALAPAGACIPATSTYREGRGRVATKGASPRDSQGLPSLRPRCANVIAR